MGGKVGLIIVGDEILEGHTHDLNTLNIARRVSALGYSLVQVRVVPDDREVITQTVLSMAGLPGLEYLFTCGGIGPTHDDVTMEAVARAMGVPLRRDEAMVERIREFYARRRWACDDGEHLEPNEASLKMAMIPEGMRVLQNDRGTAPGLWARMGEEGPVLVVLPGPPKEVEAIFEHSIAGRLIRPLEPARVEEVRVPHGESRFSHVLEAVVVAHPEVKVGSYPYSDKRLVTVRLTGPRAAVEAAAADLRERLAAGGFL